MILELDKDLFRLINHWRSPLLDMVLPWFSDFSLVLPLVVAILVWRFIKGNKRERIFWVFMILGIVVTDFICAKVLKPLFGRPRPYLALDDVFVLKHGAFQLMAQKGLDQGMRMSLSLPSCHASNCAFFSTFLVMEYKRTMPLAVLLVVLVGYSRIYLGAHYPLDILGGIMLGAPVAMAFRWILNERSFSPGKGHPQNR